MVGSSGCGDLVGCNLTSFGKYCTYDRRYGAPMYEVDLSSSKSHSKLKFSREGLRSRLSIQVPHPSLFHRGTPIHQPKTHTLMLVHSYLHSLHPQLIIYICIYLQGWDCDSQSRELEGGCGTVPKDSTRSGIAPLSHPFSYCEHLGGCPLWITLAAQAKIGGICLQ